MHAVSKSFDMANLVHLTKAYIVLFVVICTSVKEHGKSVVLFLLLLGLSSFGRPTNLLNSMKHIRRSQSNHS